MPGKMEYGTLFAQSSHSFPNSFLSAWSSFDILASVKREGKMSSRLKYTTTSNLPNIVFHNPDSMIQDPLLKCQGNNPPNTKITPV